VADERDEIRSRINVVDLVGRQVALKRAGKHWRGLCPFHPDKNPSFYVSPDTGYYKCWACGESGDAFDWVMKTQNVSFREALEILAQAAGVTLRAKKSKADESETSLRRSVLAAALDFFRAQLQSSPLALEYCAARGLDPQAIQDWELGWAPDLDSALCTHLKRAGRPLAEARTLFLAEEDASGGYFDKFRGRLMFPIRDDNGELVGFGGRLIGDGHPKYINSGDTPLFKKSRVLYGLHRAKEAVRAASRAILTEGYLDVIACHRAGLTEAVASLGTSLTEDHARLLKRWCDEVVVLFDGDAAGLKAAERALEVLGSAGLRCRVALCASGEDPDSLLRSSGPAAVAALPGLAVEPLAFRVSRIESEVSPEKDEFWERVVAALASSSSLVAVERCAHDLVHRHLRGRSPSTAVAQLLDRVRRLRKGARPAQSRAAVWLPANDNKPFAEMSAVETTFFACILDPETRPHAWTSLSDPTLFASQSAAELAAALLGTFGSQPPQGAPREWLGSIESESLRARLALSEGPLLRVSLDVLADVIARLKRGFEDRALEERKAGPRDDLRLAEIQSRLAERHKLGFGENP
jgi:DNA primase